MIYDTQKILYFVLLMTLSLVSGKEVLYEIRIDKNKLSMSKVKDRIQINHICYAHTAGDMIDSLRFHYLEDKNTTLRTSTLALSIMNSQARKNYSINEEVPANFFEFGNICSAVNTVFYKGFKDFEKIDANIFKQTLSSEMQLKWNHMELLTMQVLDDSRNQFNKYFDAIKTNYVELAQSDESYLKMGYTKYLENWLHHLSSDTYHLKFDNKRVPQCKQMQITGPSEKIQLFRGKKFFTNYFAQNKNVHNVYPVGLDFCERFVNTGVVGRLRTMMHEGEVKECDRHAVTVIGYRKSKLSKSYKEEVLLKNSRPCHLMYNKFPCKNSKVWVPLENLLKSSFSIHYLSSINL